MSSKLLTLSDLTVLNNHILDLLQQRLVQGTRVTIARPGDPAGKPLVSTVNGKPYITQTGEVHVPTRNGTVTMDQITNLGLEVDIDSTLTFEALPPEPVKLPFIIRGVANSFGPRGHFIETIAEVLHFDGSTSSIKILVPASCREWHAIDLVARKGFLTLELDPLDQPERITTKPLGNPGGES